MTELTIFDNACTACGRTFTSVAHERLCAPCKEASLFAEYEADYRPAFKRFAEDLEREAQWLARLRGDTSVADQRYLRELARNVRLVARALRYL